MDLAIYQGHNASISFFVSGKYHTVELEKFCNFKNIILAEQTHNKIGEIFDNLFRILEEKYKITKNVETLILGKDWPQVDDHIINLLSPKIIKYYDHHLGHASCSFLQSNFEESLVISYDGGGNDGTFNVYVGNKKTGEPELEKKFTTNLGVPYYRLGYPISEIQNKTGAMVDDLKIAGKLMGLVGYGEPNEELYEEIINFYSSNNFFKELRPTDEFSGKLSFDYTHNNQRVFEKLFLEHFYSFLFELLPKIGNKKNICLAGGCALNVLMNQRLINQGFNVFVPPNPDDSGISLGHLFLHREEKEQQEIVYNGVPILDEKKFEIFVDRKKNRKVGLYDLVQEIDNGKIVGIIEGDSEVGPRALGRRSIVCNPSISNMKDILNQKVKFREWFRPFAPVVRDIDFHKYFYVDRQHAENFRFMSFAPKVREEYKEILPSITHADGTARLQIIYDKNETLYKLLDEMERQNKIPVLINTSFNTKGKPTLTTYKEAFEILETTELDYVYSYGHLFYK